jgi:hypothetical protein
MDLHSGSLVNRVLLLFRELLKRYDLVCPVVLSEPYDCTATSK